LANALELRRQATAGPVAPADAPTTLDGVLAKGILGGRFAQSEMCPGRREIYGGAKDE
jgi:hypothetical protein